MSEIADFLLARIAEDEAAARDFEFGRLAEDGWLPKQVSPARVLAECEAKRRIVELHEPGGGAWCTSECASESPTGCDTLRVLAAVYADHPDYQGAARRP